ncbi:MAG: hypothetical protein HKUEN01_33670 [Candidatus Kuenenia stuttgartiensis]|uniref:PIN domain-containing protein n=1 Tax=Kuenenia stuttgartiensis TaxID=174633 RepID=Q1PVZ0_KUEST|nr:MAG: hypothetical protein HKUEN01_33670 [Candidatus Kuenenia stuttgartiensis]CAJ71395.1 unknown protein [Candidatus Kuenenia stuttgartiensis]
MTPIQTLIEPNIVLDVIKEEPEDNKKALECSVSAKAKYIISGDNHLLSLRFYKGIIILNAMDFLKQDKCS